ncbi:conserved hypothetical protein; putative signal peptide [Bradyrhizobium sp. ORS 278]|uniref:DUF2946 family protein n=1 Tax=Bradyrhizobium sp. (strain ORS 278) TaxID=114615 RepID=UPI0001507F06|nr:DUF2946 family protein [Bradyrhizobium sp. ORS 278]CAL75822.1 conserved hypothetical protein; putative signal peptide [Bradyrhizobium sp. ORS 278]
MSWFRANIKDVSRLALFALLLQFALAFGHVHWLAGQAAGNGLVTTAQASTGSPPSNQDPDQQPASDGCAICAVMAMAHSILLSPTPVLTLPDAIAFQLPDAIAATDAAVLIDAAFQARAPPLV